MYASQLSAYGVHALVVLADARVVDRRRTLAHHAITLALIALSWRAERWRVGVAIMMLCDPSDVALHGAKLARELGAREPAQLALFALFVALWCWHRLRGIVALIVAPAARGVLDGTIAGGWRERVLAALLVALALLFAAWTREIGLVVWRRARGGELRDGREERLH